MLTGIDPIMIRDNRNKPVLKKIKEVTSNASLKTVVMYFGEL